MIHNREQTLIIMTSTPAVLMLLLAVLGAGAEEHRIQTVWGMDEYPDPQSQPEHCNRDGPSNICDPNHLMTQDEGLCNQYVANMSYLLKM